MRGDGVYWLYIEMPASAPLGELDSFLRRIWMECCGHLSEFTVGEVSYGNGESLFYETRSMNTRLAQALQVGDTFKYEYDFGSTTEVEGRVVAVREGVLSDSVRILARNDPPRYACSECEELATKVCCACYELFCDACFGEHKDDEEYWLPVVNSPRMGVCGYTGGSGADDWQLSQASQTT